MHVPTQTRRVRFGAFEADLRTCELRKHGLRIKLQDQPFQVLALLLQRPGEMVSREELRQNLWPEDTFVDFDVGLNNAIKRLRDALADAAEHPRYVETLPRRGYRFIAPIENGAASGEAVLAVAPAAVDVERPPVPAPKPATELAVPSAAQPIPRWLWITVASFVALLAVVIGANPGGWRNRLFRTARAGSIHSIAVLPLENLTGDPAQEYFVDGMTEALITDLAQINTLTVISRTSVMRYKGSHKPLPEIAKELNVEGVVEGAVSRSGNRARIDAQLIYAPTDQHFWAKSYERSMSDILLLQGEVAQAIADEIRAKLTPPERARLARARQVNPEAYEAYLKGRFFWNRRVEEEVRKGMAFFQQAIQLDPGYAPAYSGLADSYTLLGFGAAGGMSAAEAEPKAKAAAEKALALDGTLAEAHASLAFIKSRSGSDLTGAEKEFQRAIELNPGYANAYFWYSQLLEGRGRRQEALEKAQRAVQLDPASPFIQKYLGETLIRRRDYDQAIEHLRLSTELAPDLDVAYLDLGYAYEYKGMLKEAIAEQQKALELSPEEAVIKGALAHAYALSGRRAEAEKLLAELKAHANEPDNDYFIASLCVALGRKDEALAWLERAFQGRSGWKDWVPYDWGLDPLRSDPRFQELLKRYGVSADVPGSH
jgi:TolB-like protein/DNA-binding winged helix-turn-helix (wHTH) protein/Flp pilus assembly protein TadD